MDKEKAEEEGLLGLSRGIRPSWAEWCGGFVSGEGRGW